MFLNREREISLIKKTVAEYGNHCNGILIYGRRRVGKSTLVREALKDYKGIFIEYECLETVFEVNIHHLAILVAKATDIPYFEAISDLDMLLQALDRQDKNIVLFIDEYQYLKRSYGLGNLDSLFQRAIDQLSNKLTIILCGSYISLMQDLNKIESPLYGRFSLVLHINPFNYLEASNFYSNLSAKDKIAFYSIFGGMPFVLEKINPNKSLEYNIKQLLLDSTSGIFIVITETLLKEIFKINQAEAILNLIGNGKAKNSDLSSRLNITSSATAQEISRLLEMEIIKKTFPINKKDDKKKTFYEINDNLLRFYYTYIYQHISELKRFGIEFVFKRYIEPTLISFISRQFEDIINQYISIVLSKNPELNIIDVGRYWYDNPHEKKNGEFDCVIKQDKGYYIIEAKFLKTKMQSSLLNEEKNKINMITELQLNGSGYAAAAGFDFISEDTLLISGTDIYDKDKIQKGIPLRDYL